jgi:D-glycero-alpha-D-manno-heptose-7-phosphate kinase
MEFTREGVRVEPLEISPEVQSALEHNLLSFFTGSSRNASEILQRQTQSSERQEASVIEALQRVKVMANEVRQALERGDLRTFGALLDENWAQKKRFAAGITNPRIDQAYETAKDAGALGGKISGAGGGGFLLLYCEPDKQESVTRALDRHGFKRMDYRFDHSGARVLMNAGLNIQRITTSVVA